MHVLCIVAAAPLRAEPAHRSEMVSQLLFGELAEVLQEQGDFYEVRCHYDGYQGWVQQVQTAALQVQPLDESRVIAQADEPQARVNGVAIRLAPGSECYYRCEVKAQPHTAGLVAGAYQLQYPASLKPLPVSLHGEVLVALAMPYLGTPYLWGGKSPWGIDCSGLVQMVYKQAGFFLPRDAWQQAEGGDVVGFLAEAQPGDLAFFDNAEGRIVHVGILLDAQRILHASGQVRIDPIDHAGIVHAETGKRTHQLRVIKRFV